MYTTLIDAQAVVTAVYSAGAYVAPEEISTKDIEVAQTRYITPVLGEAMMERLAEGDYEELLNEYIVMPLSLYIRYLRNHDNAPSTVTDLESARQYMRRLHRHLEENRALYPEYDPKRNILNKCRFHGGFVQVL
ncbi:MAG: hypothetical protein SNH01_06165 [Rikenellaceae bacterium]